MVNPTVEYKKKKVTFFLGMEWEIWSLFSTFLSFPTNFNHKANFASLNHHFHLNSYIIIIKELHQFIMYSRVLSFF